MYNIAICDDDKVFCEYLKNYIEKNYSTQINFIKTFNSSPKLIKSLKDSEILYNVFILDLSMPEKDGIAVGNYLRSIKELSTSFIIYISSYDTTATSIVGIHPYAYLKKPLDYNDFDRSLKAILNKLNDLSEHYSFIYKKNIYRIPYISIKSIENLDKRCILHCDDGDYPCAQALSKISEIIQAKNPYFVQVHTSFMINLIYLKKVGASDLILKDNTVIPISRKYKTELLKKISDLLMNF